MIKIWRSNSKNRAKDREISQQFCDRALPEKPISKYQKPEKRLKYAVEDNLLSANFGNEIILSSSGQAKVDNLNSCLTLVSSDFIVF